MEQDVAGFIGSVVAPLFSGSGIGAVISGLMVFVVGWFAFSMVLGRKE